MDFSKMIEIQKDFDSRLVDSLLKKIETFGNVEGIPTGIVTKKQLEDSNFLLSLKILGLGVEVSELANATKCFKYWSRKPAESREKTLEELVDIFHLLFSVTNSLKFEPDEVEASYIAKYIINMERQDNGY